MKRNNKKGFTIVELVIVIAVIAILAGVLIPTFAGIVSKANKSAAQQEAAALYKEVYALDMSDGKLDGLDNGEAITIDGKTGYTYEVTDGTVEEFSWTVDGYTATFDGAEWTVEKAENTPTEAPTEAPAGNAG